MGRYGGSRRIQPHQRDDAGHDDRHGRCDLQLVPTIDFRLGRLFCCLRKSATSYFFFWCHVLGRRPVPPQRKKEESKLIALYARDLYRGDEGSVGLHEAVSHARSVEREGGRAGTVQQDQAAGSFATIGEELDRVVRGAQGRGVIVFAGR